MPTRRAFNKTKMANNLIMANRTFDGSIVGIDIDYPTPFSNGFVIDKALQLPECPFMHPLFVSVPIYDTIQVFHNEHTILFDASNNTFAYIMVNPSHKTCPSARDSLELSLSRLRAFGLESANHLIMLDSETFDLLSIEYSIGCDCQFVDIAVDSNNIVFDFEVSNIFAELKKKIALSIFVNFKQTFTHFPSEVFFITLRNREWNFNPTFHSSNTQDIIFTRERMSKSITYGCVFYDWSTFSSFNHYTSLTDTDNHQLSMQFESFSDSIINYMVKFEFMPYFLFPSSIDAELQSLFIDSESLDYLRSGINLNFSGYSTFHLIDDKEVTIYKDCGEISL